MLQRFQIPTIWLLSCALVCTLEIVFSNVLLYCCAVLCDESHNLFTLNIAINKSIQVNTPTRSLLMLTYLPFRNVITRITEVWTRTKILSSNICYFVAILRFVVIYAIFGKRRKRFFFGKRQCSRARSALLHGIYCISY